MAEDPTASRGTTRRNLLRIGVIGGAALVVGGIGLELQSTALLPVPDVLQSFSPRAYRVLTAVADTFCPGDGKAHPSASEVDVPADIDAYVATLHPADAGQLEQVLRLLESPLVGLLVNGRTRPFTQLSPVARQRVLLAWRDHRLTVLRSAYMALRNLVGTTYHANPRVHVAVGYPGPPDYGQADAPAIQPRQPAPAAQPEPVEEAP
ncbi:MAG: gluconate 2-dehydrogenase subunit 3 family protein [Myxococcota bacterium]